MSATDYTICPGIFKAYIAKTRKNDPSLMTDDRREITEQEIASLIDWWLHKHPKGIRFGSLLEEEMDVLLVYTNRLK